MTRLGTGRASVQSSGEVSVAQYFDVVSDAFSMDGDGVDEDELEWAQAGEKLPGRSSR